MRSDKLGYNAPIEVYDNKFYRYAEDDYSIDNSPLTTEVCDLISDAVEQLKHYSSEKPQTSELTHILDRVRQQLQILLL
jgi:hypothetical protein